MPPASPPVGGPPATAEAALSAGAASTAMPHDPPRGRARRAQVPTRAAVVMVVVAGIVGIVGGALLVGAAMTTLLPEAVGTPSPIPSIAATPRPTLPAGVAAGILQVAAVNDRLASAVVDLTAALAVKRPAAADIAPLLRKIAADTRSGLDGSARIAAWPAAGPFLADVAALYTAAAAVSAEGLNAPLTANAAYATAGRRMLKALDSLPAVAGATREAAARAGVTLPDAVPVP